MSTRPLHSNPAEYALIDRGGEAGHPVQRIKGARGVSEGVKGSHWGVCVGGGWVAEGGRSWTATWRWGKTFECRACDRLETAGACVRAVLGRDRCCGSWGGVLNVVLVRCGSIRARRRGFPGAACRGGVPSVRSIVQKLLTYLCSPADDIHRQDRLSSSSFFSPSRSSE